jgi:type IV secretory pathway VirB4 component
MDSLYPWRSLHYVNGVKSLPVILGDGGELSATIAFAGKDLRTSSDYDLICSTGENISIIADLASEQGFYTHHDLTTAPSEYARAPWFRERDNDVVVTSNDDAVPMVRLLSEKRMARHKGLVEPVIFLTLSYQPPKLQLKWFKQLLFGGRKARKAETHVQEALLNFNNRVERLIGLLSSRLGSAYRLNAERQIAYCYYVLTGIWTEKSAPKESGLPFAYLMQIQRNDDEDAHTFSVRAVNSDVHIRAVTLYGMPEEIRPEFFDDMSMLGAGMRWCTRMILVPPAMVREEYTQQWIRYKSGMMDMRQSFKKAVTGEGEVDPVQEELANVAREDVKETSKCAWGAQLVSSVIIYRTSADLADEAADMVAEYITRKKKPCAVEDVGIKLAFATTVPGCSEYHASRDLLPDWPAASSLPCSVPYTGPDSRGGMTSLKQSVAWQFTIKDIFPARVDFGNGQNRHFNITAPVRAGKSTFLQKIIADILANMENPFVYLLDVNVNQSASRIACEAMGGVVLSFGEGTAAVQPFRDIDDPKRRSVAKRWVKQCIRAHGFDDRRPSVDRRIEEAFNLLARYSKEHRTTENFMRFVQDLEIKQCMRPFATGDYAPHVGGNRNLIGQPPYVVVDCTGLMSGESVDEQSACVISALIDEITFTVSKHTGHVQLCIDEAAQVFPFIGGSLKTAYKSWPKQGGGISLVIHNPSDLDEMGATGRVITQNVGAWVCLMDQKAKDNPAYAKHLQLTDFQMALLSEMRKGDFMLKIDTNVRVLQTDLSPLERWVLGQGGHEAYLLAEKLDRISNTTDEYGINLLKEGNFYDEAKWIEGRSGSSIIHGLAAE